MDKGRVTYAILLTCYFAYLLPVNFIINCLTSITGRFLRALTCIIQVVESDLLVRALEIKIFVHFPFIYIPMLI